MSGIEGIAAVNLPDWMLRDAYGPDVAFNPSPCFRETGWIPQGQHLLHWMSGGQIAVAGDVPILCHRSTCSPTTLLLLRDVGFPEPSALLPFDTEAEYRQLLDKCAEDGQRVAFTHVQARDVLRDSVYWISRDLLCSLNDKGNLRTIAPAEFLARRELLTADEFQARPADANQLPVAVKTAGPLTSGAGYGVKLCRTPGDWLEAQRQFQSAPRVVVEEWIDIAAIWCVQFIARRNAPARLLGAAEQVSLEHGGYDGNWIHAEDVAPQHVIEVARRIVEAAAREGFYGVCGIDVVVATDGTIRVIDPNFRMNGSSVPLALRSWMTERGATVGRSRHWAIEGSLEDMDRIVRRAVSREHMIPYAMAETSPSAARVSGLVIGESRDEVRDRIRRLRGEGLS